MLTGVMTLSQTRSCTSDEYRGIIFWKFMGYLFLFTIHINNLCTTSRMERGLETPLAFRVMIWRPHYSDSIFNVSWLQELLDFHWLVYPLTF